MTTNMSLGFLAAGLGLFLIALVAISVLQGNTARQAIAHYDAHPVAMDKM